MGKNKRKKRLEIGDGGAQPYWAPTARPSFTRAQQASIVARHLVPLACLALFGGSVLQFLLLSVFNIAFTVAVALGWGWVTALCLRALKGRNY